MIDALHVFVGPTLTLEDRKNFSNVEFHSPVVQGDVYQLVESRPLAIGIIDGYFERVPAVWHKEILWALSQGIHVFGSASMGALRAAELAPFGMVGVGEIFNDFKSGKLEDDDEVTLLHTDEQYGYKHGSVPMVNVRATLNAAVVDNIINKHIAEKLVQYVKGLFYTERNYDAMFAWATDSELPADDISALKLWLAQKENLVDLKRGDAIAMLQAMDVLRSEKTGPKRVTWTFQNTDAWAQVKRTMPVRSEADCGGMPTTFGAIVDELRLNPREYAEVKRQTVLRQLSIGLSLERGETPSRTQTEQSAAVFRQNTGLLETQAAKSWLREQFMTEADFEGLMEDQVRIDRVSGIAKGDLDVYFRDTLKYLGRYGELARRAEQKLNMEMSSQYFVNTPEEMNGDLEKLKNWFFVEHLGEEIPADIDTFVQKLDLPSADYFFKLVRRDYAFKKLM